MLRCGLARYLVSVAPLSGRCTSVALSFPKPNLSIDPSPNPYPYPICNPDPDCNPNPNPSTRVTCLACLSLDLLLLPPLLLTGSSSACTAV